MKIIKTLDKNLCLEIISKHTDILKEEQDKLTKYFKGLRCLTCNSDDISMLPIFKKEEKDGIIRDIPVFEGYLPKQMAKCNKCDCEFEPFTKLITKL